MRFMSSSRQSLWFPDGVEKYDVVFDNNNTPYKILDKIIRGQSNIREIVRISTKEAEELIQKGGNKITSKPEKI